MLNSEEYKAVRRLSPRQRELLRAAYDARGEGLPIAGRGQYMTASSLHRVGLIVFHHKFSWGPGRAYVTDYGRRVAQELDAGP